MFVKICGITHADDGAMAIAAGADALGLVFWPDSPRAVDPERARPIAALAPDHVMVVGVFVNQPVAFINHVAAEIGLDAVQLHGDEDPAVLPQLTRPVIKAVGLGEHRHAQWPPGVTLLVDAADPVRRGGTGRLADWTAAAALASERRVILAGGLTAENVARAIAAVAPYGIDVSSGVERTPGHKDQARLAALFGAIAAVRSQGPADAGWPGTREQR